MYLNIKLDEREAEAYEKLKALTGLKSNSEFLRYILTEYFKEKQNA